MSHYSPAPGAHEHRIDINVSQLAADEALARYLAQQEELAAGVVPNQADGNNANNNANRNPAEVHRQVQRNVGQNVEEMRATSPRLLSAFILYQLLELAATTAIVVIGWKEPMCPANPLRIWLILFSGRLLLLIPITVYRLVRLNQGLPMVSSIADLNRVLATYMILAFMLGNLWFYSASSVCRLQAPITFTYVLVLIIIYYAYIALPLMVLLSLCLCLPVVLLFMHLFGIGERGANDRMINSLPQAKYRALPPAASETTGPAEPPCCAICMNNFENGKVIRTLPCGHQFDKDCIDQWLRIKRECALCRHDITVPMDGGAQPAHEPYDLEVANRRQATI